jgi:hypothetical protein
MNPSNFNEQLNCYANVRDIVRLMTPILRALGT